VNAVAVLQPQRATLPFAPVTELSRPFWDGCAEGELRFQRCDACGCATFPPAVRCRTCLAAGPRWVRARGHAHLYSWTVVWRPVTEAFAVPYVPAIVDLVEDVQMMTNLVGLDPGDISPGMALEVVFHRVDGSATLPYFQPRAAGPAARVE
jgi:uncharacterized OB-fold protein